MAIRDSQDVPITVNQPTTANIRDSQDVAIPITQPTTAKVRDSQDVAITVNQPTTATIRNSQDVVIVITKNVPFTAQLEAHYEDLQFPWVKPYVGIEQGMGEGDVFPEEEFIFISFVVT